MVLSICILLNDLLSMNIVANYEFTNTIMSQNIYALDSSRWMRFEKLE